MRIKYKIHKHHQRHMAWSFPAWGGQGWDGGGWGGCVEGLQLRFFARYMKWNACTVPVPVVMIQYSHPSLLWRFTWRPHKSWFIRAGAGRWDREWEPRPSSVFTQRLLNSEVILRMRVVKSWSIDVAAHTSTTEEQRRSWPHSWTWLNVRDWNMSCPPTLRVRGVRIAVVERQGTCSPTDEKLPVRTAL